MYNTIIFNILQNALHIGCMHAYIYTLTALSLVAGIPGKVGQLKSNLLTRFIAPHFNFLGAKKP